MSFTYEFARPALTVDIVVFGIANAVPSLLVIKRALAPYKNRWALPGGFVRLDETLEKAASRELREETGLESAQLIQLKAFSQIKRDPRERVITVSFFALVNSTGFRLAADTDAKEAKWTPLHQKNLNLAFDHDTIVAQAISWLSDNLYSSHVALKVLPSHFTLTQVQQLYEGILNKKLDKRNFRKLILDSGLIKKTNKKLTDVSYRSPFMYALKERSF